MLRTEYANVPHVTNLVFIQKIVFNQYFVYSLFFENSESQFLKIVFICVYCIYFLDTFWQISLLNGFELPCKLPLNAFMCMIYHLKFPWHKMSLF